MNHLAIPGKTMSSLEISELTGKQHKHVLADIRKMLSDLDLVTADFSAVYKNQQHKEQPCFNLNEELSLTLVSGYNIKMRNAIIKRWHELETKELLNLPDFTNPAKAARAWADEVEAKNLLKKQVAIDAPKVKFAQILTESSNTRCVRVWVKGMKSDNGLKVGEREVFEWLRDKKYIFKDKALGNLPRSRYESNGLGYFSLSAFEDKKGVIRQSLQITGKVITHFSNVMEAV